MFSIIKGTNYYEKMYCAVTKMFSLMKLQNRVGIFDTLFVF